MDGRCNEEPGYGASLHHHSTRLAVESMRLPVISFILAACVSSAVAQKSTLPENCAQCLVVLTDSWNATRGELVAFERAEGSRWLPRGASVPVRIGRTGLAWGRGLLPDPALPGPHKMEGDDKAPAGVFHLGTAFGYAPKTPATKMAYLPLSNNIVCVDDPESRFYNQLVDQSRIRRPDWRSAEKMLLSDVRYKWGIVVKHNVPPQAGAGSCIFLHVWKDPQTATTGCTAMPEKAIVDLMQWLDPARRPLLIQLPAPVYKELRAKWDLPERVG